MAKKTTTKKAVKKDKHGYKKSVPFKLDVKTEAEANELISHLVVMQNTAGWQLMKQILEGNMAVLERAIVLKRDPETGAALDDEACDVLRMKRNYLEELVEKPDKLIKMFKKENVIEVPTYDPYASDPRHLQKGGSRVGAPMAHVLGDGDE